MANTFKRYTSSSIGASLTTIGSHTVASATTEVITGVSVSNITSSDIEVDIYLYNSDASALVSIITNAVVYPGGSIVPVGADQKIVMQTGDSIQVRSNAATSCDAILSVLQIS